MKVILDTSILLEASLVGMEQRTYIQLITVKRTGNSFRASTDRVYDCESSHLSDPHFPHLWKEKLELG